MIRYKFKKIEEIAEKNKRKHIEMTAQVESKDRVTTSTPPTKKRRRVSPEKHARNKYNISGAKYAAHKALVEADIEGYKYNFRRCYNNMLGGVDTFRKFLPPSFENDLKSRLQEVEEIEYSEDVDAEEKELEEMRRIYSKAENDYADDIIKRQRKQKLLCLCAEKGIHYIPE